MRILVVEGKYYEIPEYIKNDQVALDYIASIDKIADEELREMMDNDDDA